MFLGIDFEPVTSEEHKHGPFINTPYCIHKQTQAQMRNRSSISQTLCTPTPCTTKVVHGASVNKGWEWDGKCLISDSLFVITYTPIMTITPLSPTHPPLPQATPSTLHHATLTHNAYYYGTKFDLDEGTY